MMQQKVTPRKSNIELYRVIVMLLIIAHHYVVNSGLMAADGPIYGDLLSLRSQFFLIFGAFGKTGINCFTLITGYFMCFSKISLRKYVKLLFQIEFYKVVIFLIFLAFGRESVSLMRIVKLLLPAFGLGTGYVGSFVLFYLLIPFLNVLIRNLTKKQHALLLFVLLGMHCGFAILPTADVTFNYVGWFCVVYLLGAYLRLHPCRRDTNCRFWGWMTLLSVGASIASVFAFSVLYTAIDVPVPYYLLTDAHKVLAVTNALCSFMWFKNLNLSYKKNINRLGEAAFGVLLIHANSEAMRTWLWEDVLRVTTMYYTSYTAIYAIVCVIVIFALCAVIELLRIRWIERPFMRLWDRRLQDKVVKFYEEKLCTMVPILKGE